MNNQFDNETRWLVAGVTLLLVIASIVGRVLARRAKTPERSALARNINERTRAWWIMAAIFMVALATGTLGSVILFGLVSFLALREFITLTPTRLGDHRTLFWAFFIVTPLQYWLVAVDWYGLFSILIPVYAFLFLPIRTAAAGDCERFLERTAKVQAALMICVYCVSHAPAILNLQIPGFDGEGAKLLFFLVVVVQMSDVLQYVWGKAFGRRKVAPTVSPNKTWEGLIGGTLSASLLGAALWWITPFTPVQAFLISLLVTFMGFGGGLVMSAIKRDRGVKDYGSIIQGHGGVLDRVDSLCFAAPVFFHLTRFYFT